MRAFAVLIGPHRQMLQDRPFCFFVRKVLRVGGTWLLRSRNQTQDPYTSINPSLS